MTLILSTADAGADFVSPARRNGGATPAFHICLNCPAVCGLSLHLEKHYCPSKKDENEGADKKQLKKTIIHG